jgi:hypothetical protein
MAEELGKIEKPEAESFRQGRKIYLVPLIYSGEGAPAGYKERCISYWQQVEQHLSNLEMKIGKVKHIYHESIPSGDEEGMKVMGKASPDSHKIARDRCEKGAILEAFEDSELLAETTDWERCLLIGISSAKVADKVFQSYREASQQRFSFMINRISETLKASEAGLLFLREGSSLQFPEDIEVFSISPPALDEIHRWIRNQAQEQPRSQAETQDQSEEQDESKANDQFKDQGKSQGENEVKGQPEDQIEDQGGDQIRDQSEDQSKDQEEGKEKKPAD